MNNTKDYGGAAFPTNGYDSPNHGWQHGQDGMSLRDYFAAAALQGILANPCLVELHEDYNLAAKASLNFADAMLQARKEGA